MHTMLIYIPTSPYHVQLRGLNHHTANPKKLTLQPSQRSPAQCSPTLGTCGGSAMQLRKLSSNRPEAPLPHVVSRPDLLAGLACASAKDGAVDK